MAENDKVIAQYEVNIQQVFAQLDQVENKLEEAGAVGKKAFTSIGKSADDASRPLSKMQKSISETNDRFVKTSNNVRNTTGSFNALGNSINQLSRELPAFTISINTGLLAISNNYAAFQDALKQIRLENAKLIAQGKPTVSVLGQIAASVFSVGTALSIGVTLLTAFGGQIMDFIANGGKVVENEKEQKKAIDDKNKALIEGQEILDKINKDLNASIDATQEGWRNRPGGLNEQKELLEAMKIRGATEQDIFKQEQKIREVELLELRQRLITLNASGDDKLKIDFKILEKEREIRLADQKEAKRAQQKITTDHISELKRRQAILEAEGFKTIELQATILEAESALYGVNSQERKDKINEANALRIRDIYETGKEEAKAIADAQAIVSAAELQAVEIRLGKLRTAMDLSSKEMDKSLNSVLSDMQAAATIDTANANTFSQKQAAKLKQIDVDYQKEIALKSHTNEELNALDAKRAADERAILKETAQYRINQAKQYADVAAGALGAIANFQAVSAQNRLADQRRADEKEIQQLDRKYNEQERLNEKKFKEQIITESEYEAERQELERQQEEERARIDAAASERERQVKQQQAERERSYAIFVATIKEILAIIEAALNPALIPAAILAGIELAALIATPIPKFATGVIALNGPGTETSDSITARLSKGESVITARGTRAAKDDLKVANADPVNYERIMEQKYASRAAKKNNDQNAAVMESIIKAVSGSGGFTDKNIVKAIRDNRPATKDDIAVLAEEIAKSTRQDNFMQKNTRKR